MNSTDHKCLYIHIPKTAGTSIEKLLGHFSSLERGAQDHRTVREIQRLTLTDVLFVARREGLVSSARELRSVLRYPSRISAKEYASLYKFSFVRNPWARVYSWYRNVMRDEQHQKNRGIQSDCSLQQFLEEFGWQTELRPQTAWLKNRRGVIDLDFVGRFERLHSDLEVVRQALGLPEESLPHLVASNSSDYREHYSDNCRRLVENRYAEEIELFDYSFENGIVVSG